MNETNYLTNESIYGPIEQWTQNNGQIHKQMPHVRESGIRINPKFVFGMRNPSLGIQNPQKSEIHIPKTWKTEFDLLEFEILYLGTGIRTIAILDLTHIKQ